MNGTLLLQFAAPLQSWGSGSKFDNRYTDSMPTRSGIIGLLACALGMKRTEPLEIFRNLKMGARADQKGRLGVDYQLARITEEEKGPGRKPASWITYRHYLMDAKFLVGVEGPLDFLEKLKAALEHPAFPLYLGRRSCPPAGQLVLEIRKEPLQKSLETYPWLANRWYQRRAVRKEEPYLEAVMDAEPGTPYTGTVTDNPVSFDQKRRRYEKRDVLFWQIPLEPLLPREENKTEHDPMELLERDAYVSDKN